MARRTSRRRTDRIVTAALAVVVAVLCGGVLNSPGGAAAVGWAVLVALVALTAHALIGRRPRSRSRSRRSTRSRRY